MVFSGLRRRSVLAVSSMASMAAVAVLAAPLQAHAAPIAPSLRPAAQEFYWEWSDGVTSKTRTFTKAAYKNPGRLPSLIVTAEPATPQQYVKLQFKQHGTWMREDGSTTGASGSASLSLNPICDDGKWCVGTYKYRAIINGNYTVFSITYALG